MTRRQLIAARILFVLYLVAVAWLCFGKFGSLHDVQRSYWGIPTDKIAHFLMFLPFPVLAYFAFDRFTGSRLHSVLCTVGAFAAGVLVAAGTEWVQARYLPYRMGDFADFRADLAALGACSLLVLILVLLRKQNQ